MRTKNTKKHRTPLWYWLFIVAILLVGTILVVTLLRIVVLPGQGLQLFALPANGGEAQMVPLGETPDAGEEYLAGTAFVGDSNTVRLAQCGAGGPAVCMGKESIGVDAVPHLAFVQVAGQAGNCTIPEAVALVGPQRVIMTFGTNNIGGGSAEAFVEKYWLAIEAIRQAQPEVEIIVNAIPPVARHSSYPNITREAIQAYNAALLAMCHEEGLAFLDSYTALADEEGYAKPGYTIEDGLHLSEEGLQALVEYACTHALV